MRTPIMLVRLGALAGVLFAQLALVVATAGSAAYAQGGAAAPPPPPRPDINAIRKLRRRFEREPSVKEVQKAALRYFHVHPEKVAGFRNGATWKALVPDLEVTFNLEQSDNDRTLLDRIYEIPFPTGKEFEDTKRKGYTLSLRAHWSLDRLIFNAEVLDVASLVGVQEGLLREITSLYFTRRRLIAILVINPPQNLGEQITERIRLDEITANLDALTGGFLSREVKKRL